MTLAGGANAADPLAAARLEHARRSTIRLDVTEAKKELDDLGSDDRDALLTRGLYDLYVGDCDGAQLIFESPSVGHDDGIEYMAQIARGCALATAATTVVLDEERGVELRLADEDDRAFAPFLVDVAARARDALARELRVELPRPLRIEVVRDQHSLAALTGLPEQAAQTTGTVAVAKWGRVTMLSPRATPRGYPWADTLAHEMTHLAIARASGDHAPLWLQEGVAKRQETRWRTPFAFDGLPAPDGVSIYGFGKGIALPLDKLGPSIALLPSAEQAMVAYAEVTSFVEYWTRESGDEALPKLLTGLDVEDDDAVNKVLAQLGGGDLAAWNTKWRAYLGGARAVTPEELTGGGAPAAARREVGRRSRLGDLLTEHGHPEQAKTELERVVAIAPRDPSGRARLAAILRSLGSPDEARALVASLDAVGHPQGLFLKLHADAARAAGKTAEADQADEQALFQAPLEPEIACGLLADPALPAEPRRVALCEAARHASRR